MYSIEKNVPAPRGRDKYPFKTMVVGDCITLPNSMTFYRAKSAAYEYGKRKGLEFTCSLKQLRIWRTK